MSSVASILDRFRRGAGVPAVVAEDVAAELAPVFAALEELEEHARAVREEAIRDAERSLAEADARRAEILAVWRERARSEQERVTVAHNQASRREIQAVAAEAQEQARVLRERGTERLPALVEEVLACVRSAGR